MTTLRVAVRRFGPFETAIEKQFADFVRSTGAKAELHAEAFELNNLHDRLHGKRELESAAWDLAFLPTDWIAEMQADGLVADLKPLMEKAPIADWPDAWSPSLTQLQAFAGGVWGMPYHDGPECLIYRKDLLQEAGLAVPETWDDFLAVARRLHAPDRGRSGTVLALFPDGHNSFYDFCIHVWSRGGEPFTADGRPDFDTEQGRAALDFIRNLALDHTAIAPDCAELDSVKAGIAFCEGKIAIMANWFGFAAMADTWPASMVKGLVDVAPLPAGPGGHSVSLNVFWVLAIAAGSSNKDLAWAFLRHLARPEMDLLTTTEGAIGVRRSTWADPEVNAVAPYYHKLDWLHEHAREMPRHRKLAEISHIVDDLMVAATTTDRPSAELLAEAQARAMLAVA
jgi:multiple sugar transport system substrate-binding protein